MHNLNINFLKDRQEEQPLATNKTTQIGATGEQSNVPMIVGGLIMLLLPALAFAYSLQLNGANEAIAAKNSQLDTEIAKAKGENKTTEAIRAQLTQIEEENTALVNVFTKITPWSAVFQDISDRIPLGVQIQSIQEQSSRDKGVRSPIKLEIQGYAINQSLVNDFLLTLQESDFLNGNKTQIEDTRIVENAIQVESQQEGISLEELGIKPPELVSYKIITQVTDTSAPQLINELSNKGSVGIVRRIRILQQEGIPVQ